MKDEKTDYLKLPLPDGENTLDEDLPRLRGSLVILDDALQKTDEAVASGDAALHAAIEKEIQERQIACASLGENLLAEATQRVAKDDSLAQSVAEEAGARALADQSLAADLSTEAKARADGDTALAETQTAHDDSADVHAALVRRITMGDISPIIGVCQYETGNCAGLWGRVNSDGQSITPDARYFQFHPVYSAMQQITMDGQTMVRNAPFWFKTITPSSGPFTGKLCRLIAPGQTEGFRPYPAFLDTAGNVRPLYIGAFQGTDDGGKVGSRSGKMPLVSLDFPTMRARCAARNVGGVSGFRLWDAYHYESLCHLFVIEFGTPESQGIIGRGHVDSSGAAYTNADNQPKWRGYYGLWGNVWQMVDGLRLTPSRQIEVFRNDGSQTYVNTGKASPSYDGTNPAYMITNHTGAGDGFDCDEMFLPSTQTTNYAAGTFPDYFYGGSGSAGNVLYIGGSWGDGSGAGLFCRHLSDPASYAHTSIGCRLAMH